MEKELLQKRVNEATSKTKSATSEMASGEGPKWPGPGEGSRCIQPLVTFEHAHVVLNFYVFCCDMHYFVF